MFSIPDPEPWSISASCASIDPEMWFPEKVDGRFAAVVAKRICNNCPVQRECLETAINDPSLQGIWGGTSGKERMKIRRLNRMGVTA